MTRRAFGQARQLRSGRWQARFRRDGVWHTAKAGDGGPRTFTTRRQAEQWLAATAEAIAAGRWQPTSRTPGVKVPTLREYADAWLSSRI